MVGKRESQEKRYRRPVTTANAGEGLSRRLASLEGGNGECGDLFESFHT